MGWQITQDVIVVVHSADSPAPDEWASFVRDMERGPFHGILVWTGGASLDAGQRADVIASMKQHKAQAVVITESALARGAVTALRWFGVRAAAFEPRKLEPALAELGLSSQASEQVRRTLGELREAVAERTGAAL